MEELMDTQLRTFLTVCETMNFTQAARKLFLTQPAVSQHIHTLERNTGCLFLPTGAGTWN